MLLREATSGLTGEERALRAAEYVAVTLEKLAVCLVEQGLEASEANKLIFETEKNCKPDFDRCVETA